MRGSKTIVTSLAASALLAASVSSADAYWYRHRNPGPVLGLLGGIIVGAVTIATLPLAIVGDAVNPGPPPDYYGRDAYAYGPPQNYWGDGYGYNYGDGGNYGPPPPPPPGYYQGYAPPPGYYGNGY